MYYSPTDTPALVRTMTLNEELGQISHIFSDKTGTLTCNIMDFRKATINGVCYGEGITEIGRAAWKLQGRGAGELQQEKIKQFFRFLSICHDVIPEKVNGEVRLSASNPDDEALVCAAGYFGFEFADKRDVIRDPVDGLVKIITKGADTVMFGRLRSNQDFLVDKTDSDMRDFAIEGLRCLLISYAALDMQDFANWLKDYRTAITDLDQIDRKKRGVPNRIEDLEE
eukprot:gene26323-34439_t